MTEDREKSRRFEGLHTVIGKRLNRFAHREKADILLFKSCSVITFEQLALYASAASQTLPLPGSEPSTVLHFLLKGFR